MRPLRAVSSKRMLGCRCTLLPATEPAFPSRAGGRASLALPAPNAHAPPEAPLRYSLDINDRVAVL